MAITQSSIRNSNGINFTYITDSSSDWGSVPNSTYFKDLTDGLIHYKDATGSIQEMFSPSASGVWGISNASGVYTYYTTLTLAMAAAVAGQTIELFADVTETANVTIALKHGVIINGNGHTYKYTNNSGVMFTCATSGAPTGTISFYNINILRDNTTANGDVIFSFTGSAGYANTRLNFASSTITYNVTSGNSPVVTATDPLNTLTLIGLKCVTNGGGTAVSNNGTTLDSVIECSGASSGHGGGTIRNTRITTTSGTGVVGGAFVDCTIICNTSGKGCVDSGGYDSYVTTNTGNCFDQSGVAYCNAFNCVVRTTSGICFRRTIVQQCIVIGGTSTVVDYWFNYNGGYEKFYNNYFVANTASPVFAVAAGFCELHNSTIIQNGSGPAVRVAGTSVSQEVVNCTISVSTAASNCINATAAANAKYTNNVFKGATTPVNANVVQQVVNTQDNQGNILI